MVSDKDIRDVAMKIGLKRDDLHKLYGELLLTLSEIEKEERNADTKDYSIQAVRIISFWREKNGKEATRKKILDALQMCNHNKARQMLEEKWGSTIKGIYN